MNNLKELISIESYKDKETIISYLQNKLENKVKEIEIIKNKENDDKSILIGINTLLKDAYKPIVLSGHIDTVNPDFDKYKTNPFKLIDVGGLCYGLGTIDMKSFTAIIIDNIEKLKKFKTPIIAALTTDEETNLICIKNVIKRLKELRIKPYFTIVGEPTNLNFNITSKGCYEYKIEVFGKTCHSSKVEEGINAINVLAKIISFIETKQDNYKNLTSNCGIVNGGNMVNRVPDYACLNFDIRTLNTDEKDFIEIIKQKILELEKEYFGVVIKLEKLLEILPLTSNNNKNIKDIANLLGVKIGDFSGGCEAGYYKNYSGEAIIFGVGDISLAHKPNEYVVKSEYEKYSKLLLKLIKILDKGVN